MKYLYLTKDDGIYFWRDTPHPTIPYKEPPKINSNTYDILLDGRPTHGPMDLHGYVDADWAACPKI